MELYENVTKCMNIVAYETLRLKESQGKNTHDKSDETLTLTKRKRENMQNG